MLQSIITVMAGFLALLLLGGCTRDDYLLVKKGDLSTAQECLLVQKQYQPLLESQQEQLQDMLGLLQESILLHGESLTSQQVLRKRIAEDTGCTSSESEDSGSETHELEQPAWGDKQIIGKHENILLTDVNIIMTARVDTGAETSSLDARDIQEFERNGEDWVRFRLVEPDSDKSVELERERVRLVRIFQSTDEEGERRPVVEMRITLGTDTQIAEFTLADREHLDIPVLIGRNILQDMMLVDVSQENLLPLVLEEARDGNGQNAQ